MILFALTFAMWFWHRPVAKEQWKQWKNLRDRAERLQENAVNLMDFAVVLELTFNMVSSATKN